MAAVIAAGSEKVAAHRLGLSHSTVKHHLASARTKVGATTTAQLVWIWRRGCPLLLAAIGGVLGVAAGMAIGAAYATSEGWLVVVSLPAVAVGLGAMLLVGSIAGLYPAIRAANVPPTDALRAG